MFSGLTGWLKKKIADTGNVVQGVERQLNPFDNGATYSNSQPQATQPSSFSQTVHQAANYVPSLLNFATGNTAGAVTSLPQVQNLAFKTVVQPAVQAPVRAIASVTNKPSITAPTALRPLLGDQPIQNVQNYARQTVSDVGSLGGNPNLGKNLPSYAAVPLGLALTAGDVAIGGGGAEKNAALKGLSAANDAKTVAGILTKTKGLENLAKDTNTVKQIANTTDAKQIEQLVQKGLSAPLLAPNKFTEGVKVSPEVSPVVQEAVSGQHAVRSTKGLASQAEQFVGQDLGKATQGVHDALAVPDGQINDQTVANAIKVAQANDFAGNHDHATSIYDALSNHLVKSGQTIQAASLLTRRTPEGLQYSAQKILKKAGVELTPELQQELHGLVDAVRQTTEGSPERDSAILRLTQAIHQRIPSTTTDKALGFWKAGLLTGAKTQTGNVLSNATFEALHKASNPLATLVDQSFSLFTGQRAKTGTLRGTIGGTGEGIGKGWETLKTGIDARNATGSAPKFDQGELNFKHKILGKYVNGIFRTMNAADQPFFYSSLRNNLYDVAKADGLNQGLKGKALLDHMEKFVANPPTEAFQTASDAAAKSVLGYDTALSNAATKLRKSADEVQSPAGRVVAKASLNVLAPFTKVPSAFLSRTVDFTPAGAIKEVVGQMSRAKFDQRAMATALSEATTGSAVIYLGGELAKNGLLSGDYPTDPTEQQRWKAEGVQPNSVHIGDKWYSMNYFGPVGILFNIGKHVTDVAAAGEALPSQTAAAIAGLGKSLTGQSFLQGLNNAISAVNDPGRYATNVVRSTAGSIVPTLSNDIARAVDPLQRQVNSVTDAIASRIPNVRQSLPEAKDAFGNPIPRASTAADQLVNPFRPSNDMHTPLLTELDRLQQSGNSIFPTPDKTIKAGQESFKLTPQQADQFNTSVGQKTQEAWSQLTQDPSYQALPDDKKKAALQSAADDIRAVEKVRTLQSMGETKAASEAGKKLTGQQLSVARGDSNSLDYLSDSGLKKTDPKKYYQQQVDKFNRDKASMSAVERYQKQQELGRLSITSNYSADVNALYSMNKNDRTAALAQDPNLNSLMPDVAKLSAELKSRNFTATDRIATGGRKGRKLTFKIATARKIPSVKVGKAPSARIKKVVTGKAAKKVKVA